MQDFIWDKLQQLKGIDRRDTSTWSRRWAGINRSRNDPVYQPIAAARLCGAVSQLLGRDRWDVPSNWGPFLITFPARTDAAWELTNEN